MLEITEKIKKFSTEVLSEANESGQRQIDAFTAKQKEEYDKAELQYLQEGYNTIQNGLKKIDKEKSSLISKAMMDNRVKLLQKRSEIVDNVFEKLNKKLKDFTKTEDYKKLLEQRITNTVEVLGEGTKKIILTERDFEKYQEIQKKYPDIQFQAESKRVDMFGGCKGYNLTKNIFYENTFAKQIEDLKLKFLQDMATELKIEA